MFRAMFGFEGANLHKKKVILDSSMVEHSAVNRVVAGSSPARGARAKEEKRSGSSKAQKNKAPWSSG